MTRLITVQKAKEEIERLQAYVELVEGYKANNIEQKIIKEYANTNCIVKVMDNLYENGLTVDYDTVVSVIRSKPADELHRIIRKGYMLRTKHSRRKGGEDDMYNKSSKPLLLSNYANHKI
jgi:hypothetical protein